jgi:polyisoprenoid-binding protein YceI
MSTQTTTARPPSAAIRSVDGVVLPAPGVWIVDPGHAEVGFVGRHFMLTKVRGRFTDVDATVRIADDPNDTEITAVIAMASVNSGDATRDDHLRSDDFFDVEQYPQATFRSTRIDWNATAGTLVGDLTIKGVTRQVGLTVDYLGHARDPWDNDRAVFEAHGEVDRRDWDLTWNMTLDTGGLLVSNAIKLELQVELIRQT